MPYIGSHDCTLTYYLKKVILSQPKITCRMKGKHFWYDLWYEPLDDSIAYQMIIALDLEQSAKGVTLGYYNLISNAAPISTVCKYNTSLL